MRNRIIRPDSKMRMPVIGKIKVGEKIKKNGKELPVSLDHFIADGNYKHIFEQKFGKEPKTIDIIFISDDPKECCVERLEIRKGSKLFAKGDGHTFEVWDGQTQKYVVRNIIDEPYLVEEIEKACSSQFEEILTLYFLILGINEVFGVWKFQTKGKDSSIPSIVSSFDKVFEIAGRVKFIPFTMAVEKVKSQKPDSKSSFPVVSLVANIGQEYLDKLQQHLTSGVDISGIITQDKIDYVVAQQIEDKTEPTQEAKVQYEFSIIPEIKQKIKDCKDIEKMSAIGQEINKMDLPEAHKIELRQCYSRQLHGLKQVPKTN